MHKICSPHDKDFFHIMQYAFTLMESNNLAFPDTVHTTVR